MGRSHGPRVSISGNGLCDASTASIPAEDTDYEVSGEQQEYFDDKWGEDTSYTLTNFKVAIVRKNSPNCKLVS